MVNVFAVFAQTFFIARCVFIAGFYLFVSITYYPLLALGSLLHSPFHSLAAAFILHRFAADLVTGLVHALVAAGFILQLSRASNMGSLLCVFSCFLFIATCIVRYAITFLVGCHGGLGAPRSRGTYTHESRNLGRINSACRT